MRNRGFTLIEIVIVTSIIVIVFGMILIVLRNMAVFDRMFQSTLASQAEAQTAFRRMSSEIRSLQPSAQGAYPIAKADEQEFIFFRDITGDGNAERIRYAVEDGNLKKGVIIASGDPLEYDESLERMSILVANVSGVPFVYFGESGELLSPASPTDVRSLSITIDANRENPATGQPVMLTTTITPRNVQWRR